MKDDYKITGATSKLNVEVEKEVVEALQQMSEYKKLSVSEITNTALKRFIAGHKDFMPPHYGK